MSRIRLVDVEDADRLSELAVANREFLAPYEPPRTDSYYTVAGQRTALEQALARHRAGMDHPAVILDDERRVVGRIGLSSIVRGPLLSATVSYWVSQDAGGAGLAGSALGELADLAFTELGLHRLEAGTLVDNHRSQRVLERNGFTRFGLAPRLVYIDGAWRDHLLFSLLSPRPCLPDMLRGRGRPSTD